MKANVVDNIVSLLLAVLRVVVVCCVLSTQCIAFTSLVAQACWPSVADRLTQPNARLKLTQFQVRS